MSTLQPSTTDPAFSLGEDFEDTGFCDVYTYYPHDELFAVSAPFDSICDGEGTNSGKETVFMLEGTMYFGLVFLLIVMIQSMEKNRVDWYRLIAFYLIGTLGVPLSNEFGPNASGFNRFIGFGVLVHNMAEATILAVIWRGTQNKNSQGVRLMIVYFWLMLLCITFLPLHVLLWVSAYQGATLDYFLVTSFCTIGVAFKQKGKFFWIAFAASLMHILTIQPLFFGMALGWGGLSAPTVIFLVPTFMLYIWFASSDPRATLQLSQNKTLVQEHEFSTRNRHESVQMAVEVVQRLQSQSLGGINPYQRFNSTNSMHSTNNIQQQVVSNESSTNNNKLDLNAASISSAESPQINGKSGSANKLPQIAGEHIIDEERQLSAPATTTEDIMLNDEPRTGTKIGKLQTMQSMSSIDEAEAIGHIVESGLFKTKLKMGKGRDYPRLLFKRALFFALIGSTINELLLIFAPCYVDTKFLCD